MLPDLELRDKAFEWYLEVNEEVVSPTGYKLIKEGEGITEEKDAEKAGKVKQTFYDRSVATIIYKGTRSAIREVGAKALIVVN